MRVTLRLSSLVPSFLKRFWDTVKPPPAVKRWRPTPRQKRMLIGAVVGLAVIAGAAGTWDYIAYAPQRARREFDDGSRNMVPGRYELAVRSFDRAIEIWPFPEAYYERGVARRTLGDARAAAADFTRAIEQKPQYGEAYTERGMILRDNGDLEGALRDISRAVEIEPSSNGYYQRGEIYASAGQPQKALEDFDRAIGEQRDAPYIYRARAEVKRSLGDMAGYQADRDISIRAEYREVRPAWVDLPLPADHPAPETPAKAADKKAKANRAAGPKE